MAEGDGAFISPIDSGALRCGQVSRTHTAWSGLGLGSESGLGLGLGLGEGLGVGLGVGLGFALTLPLFLMPYLFPRITVEDNGLAP